MTIKKAAFDYPEVDSAHQNAGNLAILASYLDVEPDEIHGTITLNGGRENGFASIYGVIARPGNQQLMTDNGPVDANLVIERLGLKAERAFIISYMAGKGSVRTMNTVLSIEDGPDGEVLRVIDIFPKEGDGVVSQEDNTLLPESFGKPGIVTRIHKDGVAYVTISDYSITRGRVVDRFPGDGYTVSIHMTPEPETDTTSAREIENTLAAIMQNNGSRVTLVAGE